MEYYNQALECYAISDSKSISIVKNNIAMLYLEQGNLNEALDNIKTSMDILNDDKDIELKYKYLHTYTLIMIERREPMEALELLLDLIEHTYDQIRYKKSILMGIETLLDYGINYKHESILLKIQKLIIQLIEINQNNQDFVLHLKAFLGEIFFYNNKEKNYSIKTYL